MTMRTSPYYVLDPEVPGELGERTELEVAPDGSRVLRLHYEFRAGCQGDDLATSHPVFIISERVGLILQREGLSGFRLAEMEQSVDDEVRKLRPGFELPTFRWLQLTGTPGQDDFGVNNGYLIVSERALSVLQRYAQLSLCEIEPWTPLQ